MDFVAALVLFFVFMIISLIKNVSMIIPIFIGYVLFSIVAMRRGVKLTKLFQVTARSMKRTLMVVSIILIIGMLTASWRCSGTILYFVYWGIKLITPQLFLLIAFLLTALMSYSIGSSFGVACTLGVIFMALARSGGVNEIITAGVLMSGVYFGDRASPASSSMILISAVTSTKMMDLLKALLKTSIIPMIICTIVYTILSLKNPLSSIDDSMMHSVTSDFKMCIWLAIPALIMIVLPIIKVNIKIAMLLSIITAGINSIFIQGVSFTKFIYYCILGYSSENSALGTMLNGGGAISMVEISIILFISCAYSSIFEESGMITTLHEKLENMMKKTNRITVTMLLAILLNALFCNQTIAIVMDPALLEKPYKNTGGTNGELAVDIANSTSLIAGLIPWNIACSVPLGFWGMGAAVLPFAVYLYIIPLCHLFRRFIKKDTSLEGTRL